jgi:hypothetical protein
MFAYPSGGRIKHGIARMKGWVEAVRLKELYV